MLKHKTFDLMYIIKKHTFNPHIHSFVGVLLVSITFDKWAVK